MSKGIGIGLLLVFSSVSTQAETVRVGDMLPPVTFVDSQGGNVRVGTAAAGVTIIDFWASWCHPCRAALPELNAIAQRHAADGLRIVAINIDKSQKSADDFLKTYLPTPAMTLLRDAGGAGLARYGASGMPALYVVDQRGVVRLVESGFVVEELRAVEALAEQLLSPCDNAVSEVAPPAAGNFALLETGH